jgi:hypothetical protein
MKKVVFVLEYEFRRASVFTACFRHIFRLAGALSQIIPYRTQPKCHRAIGSVFNVVYSAMFHFAIQGISLYILVQRIRDNVERISFSLYPLAFSFA